MKEEFLKYFPQHIQAILNEEDLNSIEETSPENTKLHYKYRRY